MLPMRVALFVSIGAMLFCGCRVNPNAEREIALLRAEILDLEDQYFSLKSQRDTAVDQLRDCQGPSFDPHQFPELQMTADCIDCQTGPIVYEDAGFESIVGAGVVAPGSAPSDLNTMDQIQSFESGSPVIDRENEIEEIPATEAGETESEGEGESTSILNRRSRASLPEVTAIRINRRLSQGQDLDGAPGHEGLSLFIQPVNRSGQVVDLNGQMTVQLFEKDRLASSRQLGFWRFTSEEINSFQVRRDLPDQGVLLHLPWNEILPTRNAIDVVVNFVAENSLRYTSRLQIPIEPPARRYTLDQPLIANWIENDERWQSAGSSIASDGINFGSDIPEFQDNSDSGGFDVPDDQPESNRRTSVPRWRPVR